MVMQTEVTQDMTYVLADLNNRVRTLESKYNLFGERLLVINQNMIEEYKKLLREMKAINLDMQRIKAESAETRAAIKNVVSELDLFARKENVRVVEKYLELLSPMNFVTEQQVERVVEEKMGKQGVE
jgi:chaperonin cofactor prefoldin